MCRRLVLGGLENEAELLTPSHGEHLTEVLPHCAGFSFPPSLPVKHSQCHHTVFPRDKTRDLGKILLEKMPAAVIHSLLMMLLCFLKIEKAAVRWKKTQTA